MSQDRSQTVSRAVTLLAAIVLAVLFWDRVRGIVIFATTLGILIAVHEWGHFIAARAASVRVYEFALGFGPRLITYMQRNGTDYTIRAFPLGGFVNPKGMQPEDPITHDGINGRRPAERAMVFLAGPLMNAILGAAVLMLSGVLAGTPDLNTVLIGEVKRKSEASRMQVLQRNGQPASGLAPGLRTGDRLLAVNGEPIRHLNEVTGKIHPYAGRPLTMTVQRGPETLVLQGTPKKDRSTLEQWPVVAAVPPGTTLDVRPGDQLDTIDGQYPFAPKETPDAAAERMLREKAGKEVTLKIWRDGNRPMTVTGPAVPLDIRLQDVERERGILGFSPMPGQGPRVSLAESVDNGLQGLAGFAQGMAAMFSRPKQLKESTGGVIGIGVVLGQVGQLPFLYYLNVFASLSLSLAVFNLLPIPNLDGGHMLLLTWEVVRRRRLEPETQRAVALVGLVIIGVLFVLITWNDITKHLL